jgi:Ricin-type beta-trefoil lectin domain
MCMATSGGANNAPAILWTCKGSKDQLWQFENVYTPKNFGGYTFMNLVNNNGDCLGTEGGNITEGTPLYAWKCLGHADQFWAVEGSVTACRPYAALLNYSAYEEGANFVVGVSGGEGNIKDDAPLVIWNFQRKCNNQMWNFIINS